MVDLVVDVDEAAARESALSGAADRVGETAVRHHLDQVAIAVEGGRLSRAARAQGQAREADRAALEALLRAHAAAARDAAGALVMLDLHLGR